MAKQTIIDWQRDSLIVAVGQGHGPSLRVEKLSEQLIDQPKDADRGIELNLDAAQALARAIDALGVRKTDAIVVISRELVEVRTLAIPKVDADELPEIIRFQAQRQLANMGDNWPLDYVMLPDEPGQAMQTALVAVISPQTLSGIESACVEAGVQLVHLLLAPIEIARYAINSGKLPASGTSLIVCLSDQRADLLILGDGRVVQIRGTKLPSERSQLASALGGELRRTLLAASSHLGPRTITESVLFASPDLSSQAQQVITEVVGCGVTLVDPSSLLPQDYPSRQELVNSSANRIAAMAGAAGFSEADKKSTLDFKNPKKRPPPKSQTTKYLLLGAAATLLALAGVSWWVGANNALDEELARYQNQVASQKELVDIAKKRIAELNEVEAFLKASPNWLDELAYISENIPQSENVIILEPVFSTLPDGSGQIIMPVLADSSSSLDEFERMLRDDQHVVKGKDFGELERPTPLYKWGATETITVKDRGWNLVDTLSTSRSAVAASQNQSGQQNSEANPKSDTEQQNTPEEEPPIPDADKRASADEAGNRPA